MTERNFSYTENLDRRALQKYRLLLAVSLAGLALAGWMFQVAYEQHVKILHIGDQTGERLQMRGLTTNQEGAEHEQR